MGKSPPTFPVFPVCLWYYYFLSKVGLLLPCLSIVFYVFHGMVPMLLLLFWSYPFILHVSEPL